MATVYLHIGSQKTGTSAIQQFLLMNEKRLNQEGVAFPYFDIPYDGKYRQRRNAHFLVYHSHMEDKRGRAQQEQDFYEKGFETLRQMGSDYDKIVLTDEAVWYRQDEKEGFWQDVLSRMQAAGHELKVVIFLRRQDLFVQSLWNQAVKNLPRTLRSFDDYKDSDSIAHHNFDYYKKLCEIAQVVGKENMIVRSYEKDAILSSPGGIFSIFMDCIGCRMDETYEKPDRQINTDLSGNYLLIKQIMNGVKSYRATPDFIASPIARACADRKAPKVSFFSCYEDQVAYVKRFEESNSKVAKEFLGREDGILFREEIQRLPCWQADPETMDRDIIITMTELLVQQQSRIDYLERKLETKLEKLERSQQRTISGVLKKIIRKLMFWRK